MALSRKSELTYLKTKIGIVGVDEAGRGPLCGPVVCAACYVPTNLNTDDLCVLDSKATTEEEREITYDRLVGNPDIIWGVGIVSNTEIDEVNILQASLNGMKRATETVLSKLQARSEATKKAKGSGLIFPTSNQDLVALIDGNKIPQDMPIESVAVIKGDATIFSIAAASIIAKVTRDRVMIELDKKYPAYNIKQHKGYPTFEHRTLLHKHGPSEIYRFSYRPVREAAELHNYPIPTRNGLKEVVAPSSSPSAIVKEIKVIKSTTDRHSKPKGRIDDKKSRSEVQSKQDIAPSVQPLKKITAKKRKGENLPSKEDVHAPKNNEDVVELRRSKRLKSL